MRVRLVGQVPTFLYHGTDRRSREPVYAAARVGEALTLWVESEALARGQTSLTVWQVAAADGRVVAAYEDLARYHAHNKAIDLAMGLALGGGTAAGLGWFLWRLWRRPYRPITLTERAWQVPIGGRRRRVALESGVLSGVRVQVDGQEVEQEVIAPAGSLRPIDFIRPAELVTEWRFVVDGHPCSVRHRTTTTRGRHAGSWEVLVEGQVVARDAPPDVPSWLGGGARAA